MWIVLAFGVLGWLMSKTGFDPGPLVLAFVLGPILENSFRQSMLISGGALASSSPTRSPSPSTRRSCSASATRCSDGS